MSHKAPVFSPAGTPLLERKASGRVDGFVIEGSRAGGRKAPPRGAARINECGEPIYGPHDEPNPGKLRELGVPFWMAGEYATPGRLADALRIRTGSEPEVYAERQRVWNLGSLRHAYRRSHGSNGLRCPGKPTDKSLAKEGRLEDALGCKCMCNGLPATIGLGQVPRQHDPEPAQVTAGDDRTGLRRFLRDNEAGYSALDALCVLLPSTSESTAL